MSKHKLHVFTAHGANEALSTGDTHAITRVLRNGGLCLLPSDTCYAIAADPLQRGVTKLIDSVLDRNRTAISLSFGSQRELESYVTLGWRELRILDSASRREPVTIVAPVNPNAHSLLQAELPAALNSEPGHLGVRLSFSLVERQIAGEYGKPLTTVAIYYSDGQPMRSFDDAIDYMVAQLELKNITSELAAIKHPPVQSAGVSTVLGFTAPTREHHGMTIYREGATALKKLHAVSHTFTTRDVEEWT